MNDQVDIALLEKYVLGMISADQVLNLDGTKPTEEELEDAVKSYKELTLHLEGVGLKESLESIHEEAMRKKTLTMWPRILVAAAAVILIGVFAFLIGNAQKEPRISDYFTHFDQLVIFRNDSRSDSHLAIEAYSDLEYGKAVTLFEGLPTDSLLGELSFYAGISALGAGEYNKSVKFFEDAGQGSGLKYDQQIRWYKALAYWQLQDVEAAAVLLEQIEVGQFKYEEALELLEYLVDQ